MPNPILVDESVFDEAFIPERLVARKGQIEEIARCLKPARVGKSIKNLYIYGPPGVGKTLVTKWILKENFEKNSVFVNCWSKRTSHKIMEEILLQMGYVVHGKESTSDLFKKFEKLKKKPIVCLDESDHMKDTEILYVLARNSCGIILISNQAFSLTEVDYRIKSSLFLPRRPEEGHSGYYIIEHLRTAEQPEQTNFFLCRSRTTREQEQQSAWVGTEHPHR